MKVLALVATHLIALSAGFALGIYALPILVAPHSPPAEQLADLAVAARYSGEFRRHLKGSDALHWGEGRVFVSPQRIGLRGELAPGPDYKLYLSPEFVETEADFRRLKSDMVRVGDVRTFRNFLVQVPESVDVERYTTVVIWCESFEQFISAASYR